MTKRTERSLEELYRDDPERADAVVLGRRSGVSRRGFVGGAGLSALTTAVGGAIVYSGSMPAGLIPAALAQEAKPADAAGTGVRAAPVGRGARLLQFPGKDEKLILLGDRPLVAQTPEHMLDDDTTPTARFFVRNNGSIPEPAKDPDAWMIRIEGEVGKPLEIPLGELKRRFKAKTQFMVLESAGNGRAFFIPQARGSQWTNGGVGCAEWTGVPLADVLRAAGLKPSAVHTAHYGADQHLSGDATRPALSRGIPVKKALDPGSLIVFAMNGQPLPNIHGGPVRLLVPGWPGSVSQKWLSRIVILSKMHDGPDMIGTSYRLPVKPMVPGRTADEGNFAVMESMPVRSIVTSPYNGLRLAAGVREIKLRGAAWAGDHEVERVDISIDFGARWQRAALAPARNRYDWRRWTLTLKLPSDGYYEVWSRATDSRGVSQPHVAGGWNPEGYGGNPMHRIAVLIG